MPTPRTPATLGAGLGLCEAQSLNSVRQSSGGGGMGENTTQNTKQKTQKRSDWFKLLNNFIYPFCTHTHTKHISNTVIHTLSGSEWHVLIPVSPD